MRQGERSEGPLEILKLLLALLVLALLSPLLIAALGIFFANQILVRVLVWAFWLPRGKDILFVYSDSPIWREYMTEQLLPLCKERAIVLNWSERRQWSRWSFKVHVFKSLSGDREFCPLIILFRPFLTEYFRFWQPFKDWKRGDHASLDALVTALKARL